MLISRYLKTRKCYLENILDLLTNRVSTNLGEFNFKLIYIEISHSKIFAEICSSGFKKFNW